jgi:hypothetical protein
VRSGFIPVIGVSVLGGDVWAQTKFGMGNAAMMLINSTKRVIMRCSG